MLEKLSERQFEALMHRHQNQTKRLQVLSKASYQISYSFFLLQAVLTFFIQKDSSFSWTFKILLTIFDGVLMILMCILLSKNIKRSSEVINTIKNCNKALGYEEQDFYLEGKALNALAANRKWKYLYMIAVFIFYIGFVLFLFKEEVNEIDHFLGSLLSMFNLFSILSRNISRHFFIPL